MLISSYHKLLDKIQNESCRFLAQQNLRHPQKYVATDAFTTAKSIEMLLISSKPCMISRFGSVELTDVCDYIGIHSTERKSIINFVKGNRLRWWWNETNATCMLMNAGVFPKSELTRERFAQLMLDVMPQTDLLGSWQEREKYVKDLMPDTQFVKLRHIEPFWTTRPWSRQLEGKRVLVIHPFVQTIKKQYENRALLFKNSETLPVFDINVMPSVQSIGGNTEFKDWFEALQYMKNNIAKTQFDICLLGCGAYGMPLAAYIKSIGKKAIHMGGALQLLFGIRGNRWDKISAYADHLYNEHWIRPLEEDIAPQLRNVENGCYL